MPRGVARSFDERIADKQQKKSAYQMKIDRCRLAVSKLEKAEQRLRAGRRTG